jgi:stearoyl-CoA desaturase (Delta-9 desaturase)
VTSPRPPAPTAPPGASRRSRPRADDERVNWLTSLPFFAAHAALLSILVIPVHAADLVWCVVLYHARMLFLSAGYHRYFAHRSYRVGRVTQFLLALGGTTAAQKGPLWWAGNHRVHHRYADTELDPHSPQHGFWWSHVGWVLCNRYKPVDHDLIRDFAVYPELRFLDRHFLTPPIALGAACFALGGWSMLVVGYLLSTVLLWHGTFSVNSLAHLVGRRRYATPDTSRNSLLIALWTSGEGWHNNHHHLMASARHGFEWWEIDPSWYVLRLLGLLRVVRDVRTPSERMLRWRRIGEPSEAPTDPVVGSRTESPRAGDASPVS